LEAVICAALYKTFFKYPWLARHKYSHSWALRNLNETNQTHFQQRFCVDMWYGLNFNRLFETFMFEHHLTAEM